MNGTLLTAVGHDGGVDGVVSARVPVSHRLVEHQFNDPAIYLIFTWYLPGHLAHTWCRCTRHGSPLPLVPLSHRLVEYQFHEPAIYPLFTCYYLVFTWLLGLPGAAAPGTGENQFNDPAAQHRRTVRVVLVQVLVAMVTLGCRPRNRVVPRDSHVQTSSRLNDK